MKLDASPLETWACISYLSHPKLSDRSTSSVCDQIRVVVCDQLPMALPLYPYPRKSIVTRNGLACVLPDHCRQASFYGHITINANLNLIGRDSLKFQIPRSEVQNYLRLGPHGAARAHSDKIACINTVKDHPISMDLRLNAFIVQLSDRLLEALRLT